MAHLDLQEIEKLNSRYRANFINSITGYKSCNLLGTRSSEGNSNLAIFSSLLHIGSSPALIGFVLRPLTVRRDSFNNIKQTGQFTVNQVSSEFFKQAHQTAAKYKEEDSEFEAVGLTAQYLDDFKAPYVKESQLKIGCTYKNHYLLEENGCILVIGAVEHIYFPQAIQDPDGFLELNKINTVTAMGQDGYALPAFLGRLSYARPGSEPNFIEHGS
ncbi:flavin reductase family protein [Muriicola soli]|uniref:Flavin oxidoreductase n=1 Tax=Muriicola soli TaxID=2507538 RepID=A0A411E758_9FLAO|nr:flavin reductase [Muriicola soli]QBA63492.1 flavin oxidoreductase [Muriicola soli]